MRVIWSPAAAADLESIADYVARDKPDAALRLVQTVFSSVEALRSMPHRGRPGRIEGTRELVIRPYLAIYQVRGEQAEILHIFHAAQDWLGSI